MDYFYFKGTKESLELKLSEFMTDADIQTFIDALDKIVEFIDEDEYVEKQLIFPEPPPGMLSFLIPIINLNINLKATSIATIALLFDINLTLGVSSAFLSMSGFNDRAFAFLNEPEERCLVMEALRTERIINKDVFSSHNSECVNDQLICQHRNERRCSIEEDEVEKILDSLCDRNVFTKTGTTYKYNY